MTILDENELFGKFIPKPFVKKITLESAGVPPQRLDPHVKATKFVTRNGNRVRVDIDESRPGIVEGGQDLTDAQGPNSINVTLDLVIKDRIRDLQNSWFGNITLNPTGNEPPFDLRRFVKIYVVQCLDNATVELVLNPSTGYKHQPYLKTWFETSIGLSVEQKPLSDCVGNSSQLAVDTRRPNQTATSATKRQINYYDVPYRLHFPVTPKYPPHLSYFVWTEFDLNEIGQLYEFDIAGFDATALFQNKIFRSQLIHKVAIKNGKVSKTMPTYRTPNGTIWTGEILGQGNTLRSGRWVFENAGPLPVQHEAGENVGGWGTDPMDRHQISDGRWKTGAQPHPDSVFIIPEVLIRDNVKNTLVSDFRTVDRLERLKLDFSVIENKLKLNVLLSSLTLSNYINKANKRFSDMFLTRDLENNCRFFFALGWDKLLEENSLFGNLYKNATPEAKIDIMNRSSIFTLSVHRVRTKGSSETGSDPTYLSKPYYFGETNPKKFNDKSLVQSTFRFWNNRNPQPTAFNLRNNTTDDDELICRISPSSNVSQITFDGTDSDPSTIAEEMRAIFTTEQNNDVGIRYFAGVDKSVKYKTDGYYQYRVVLEIIDGAVNWLQDWINELIRKKNDLKEYLTYASMLGGAGAQNPFADPHVEAAYPGLKADLVLGNVKPGNFNVAANRFTQHFVEYAITRNDVGNTINPPWTTPREATPTNLPPWLAAPAAYVGFMESLGSISSGDARDVQTILENYISPQTGNIEGIIKVISLMETLENIIEKKMGTSNQPILRDATSNEVMVPTGPANRPIPRSQNLEGQTATPKIIKIDHTFNDLFDANIPKDIGFEIFAQPETERTITTPGFRIISEQNFRNFVRDEKMKIFQNTDIEIPITVGQGALNFFDKLTMTDYAFFTPTRMKTPHMSIDLRPTEGETVNPAPPPDDYLRMGIAANMPAQALRKASKTIADLLVSTLAEKRNLTVVRRPEPKPATHFEPGITPDSGDISGRDSATGQTINDSFLRNNSRYLTTNALAYETLSQFSQLQLGRIKNDISLYNPTNPKGYVQKFNVTKAEIGGLPNQIKALIAFSNNATPLAINGQAIFTDPVYKLFREGDITDVASKMMMRYKFETIYTLEVFTGWENVSETFGAGATKDTRTLASSNWETLYRWRYRDAFEKGESLLCRLKPHEDFKFGIHPDPSTQLPLYDKYFIIDLGTKTAEGRIAARFLGQRRTAAPGPVSVETGAQRAAAAGITTATVDAEELG